MKSLYTILVFIVVVPMYGQNTISIKYDFSEDALRNYINDVIVINENIYAYSTLFCELDDSLDATCVALTNYSLEGELINKTIIDSFNAFGRCEEGLSYYQDEIILSTDVKGEVQKKSSVVYFDKEFSQLGITKYLESSSTSYLNNTGVEVIGPDLFYFGGIDNPSGIPDSVHIIRSDLSGNELDRFYYSYGDSGLEINNFQSTPDGNFAFILELSSAAGANNGFNGYQLMKIDPYGNVLDTFVFADVGQQPNRLLVTNDGGFVFGSRRHPFDYFNSEPPGRINKMDPDMDTLEWTLTLPNDQLVDGRHYRMWDYIEASNGDIVACGEAYDNTDTELATGVADKNSTWNGFVVRISPAGEIKWLRLYKNDNDLLAHEEYGRFRPSRLHKIIELQDGRFLAGGDVYVKGNQIAAINEFETEAFHLWLLMVDENGCLEDYDCEEIIRLGDRRESAEFAIGDEWIYEEIGPGGIGIDYGFKSFEILDTVFDGTRTKYYLSSYDTFYVENNQMFFWDEYFEDYIIYFDFDETESYEIKYYDQFIDSEEIATVVIDSITYAYFGSDSLRVQHVNILNNGTFGEYRDVVYEGIGAGRYGIQFLLGCGLCDPVRQITDLRCFTNEEMTYQFVSYPCDSTWLTTSAQVVEKDEVRVYPNPTDGWLFIDGIERDVGYELYSLSGQLVQKGMTKNETLSIDNNGVYILQLMLEDSWIVQKVSRFE